MPLRPTTREISSTGTPAADRSDTKGVSEFPWIQSAHVGHQGDGSTQIRPDVGRVHGDHHTGVVVDDHARRSSRDGMSAGCGHDADFDAIPALAARSARVLMNEASRSSPFSSCQSPSLPLRQLDDDVASVNPGCRRMRTGGQRPQVVEPAGVQRTVPRPGLVVGTH